MSGFFRVLSIKYPLCDCPKSLPHLIKLVLLSEGANPLRPRTYWSTAPFVKTTYGLCEPRPTIAYLVALDNY
jgi:hypothetical protein